MQGTRTTITTGIACAVAALGLLAGCGADGSTTHGQRGSRSQPSAAAPAGSAGAAAPADSAGSSNLDFGNTRATAPTGNDAVLAREAAPMCSVPEQDTDFTVPECELSAPADSFEPVVEWTWEGGNGQGPPLVANLTDDNGDGVVDLCDTPDVVVPAGGVFTLIPPQFVASRIHILDGASGDEHCVTNVGVGIATPAIGDIDGDGVPEIVAIKAVQDGFVGNGGTWGGLIVFDNACEMKWQVDLDWDNFADQLNSFSISLIDADADGDVEIMVGAALFDHEGELLWARANEAFSTGISLAAVAADLDDDGDLEIVTGTRAYHHDGSIYYDVPELIDVFNLADLIGIFPLVADLDDDPQPEIVAAGGQGLFVLEHDGTIKHRYMAGGHGLDLGEFAPPTVHDFDGDGQPEIALGGTGGFTIFERDLTPTWSNKRTDGVVSGATAFDFLGDGVAEAIYSDADELLIFDGASGTIVMRAERTGALDYPVVADVDNDGSAEIIVVSGQSDLLMHKTAPTVQVIGDAQDRWIPTRRIWNQLNYHVTNVREDGTIPSRMEAPWAVQNTFRTNVQLEAGGVCTPPVPTPE